MRPFCSLVASQDHEKEVFLLPFASQDHEKEAFLLPFASLGGISRVISLLVHPWDTPGDTLTLLITPVYTHP